MVGLSILFLPLVMPWLDMSIPVGSIMVVANGVVPPISMASFPSVKTLQPEWFTEHPDIARSQIVILVTNEADIFVTIPGVAVRNHYGRHFHRWRSRIYHWLRSHNHEWLKRHPAIWLDDAA